MNAKRRIVDRAVTILAAGALVVAVAPLASIIYFVAVNGASAISWSFLTHDPAPPGVPGGGIANALQGTLLLIALASCVGLPAGLLSGVYVSEYGSSRYAQVVRFLGDVLSGIPSIVTGILVYLLIVIPFHHFSALAGGVALGTIMIPIVSNTTSEALGLVPNSIREASTALGIRKWRTSILALSNAKAGVATGVLLAIARTTGETAPLLLTALGSTLGFAGLDQPVASMTVLIYDYATSPFKDWQAQAWGASFLLLVVILCINVAVRYVTRRRPLYA
jgi:phosphate transport system permease protein